MRNSPTSSQEYPSRLVQGITASQIVLSHQNKGPKPVDMYIGERLPLAKK